jgi:flagellar biosynthesis/type III secretory pathway protein FliH
MEKPSSNPGSNQSASSIVEQTTPPAEYHKETEQETHAAIARIKEHISNSKARIAAQKTKKNPAAVALGRLGGLKSGKARAEKVSPARKKIASFVRPCP